MRPREVWNDMVELPEDLRALMDQATSLAPPALPSPWPAPGQRRDEWAAEVALTRARHEAWSRELATTLAGGAGPGSELPPAPPAAAGNDVREVVEGDVRAWVYVPEGAGPFPAVLVLHGGGWWIGGGPAGMEAADPGCRMVCSQLGAVVVNVDYRQAPEHQFPVALEDCYAALRWVHDHAGELSVDPAKVAVMGPSAGGNLTAAVVLLARARGGPAICQQVLMVPCLDATLESPSVEENGTGFELTKDYVETAWQLYLGQATPRTHPLASPLHEPQLAELPPAHIAVAEFDPIRDDGLRYAERLIDAGVSVTVSRYPMGHSVMTPAVGADYLGEVLAQLSAAFTGK